MQQYNFKPLLCGDTWYDSFTWFQADGVTPVNLTGYKARMQLLSQASNTTNNAEPIVVLCDLQSSNALSGSGNGFISLGGTLGTISWSLPGGVSGTFTVPATTTSMIDPSHYLGATAALILTDSGGVAETVLEGIVVIEAGEVAAP